MTPHPQRCETCSHYKLLPKFDECMQCNHPDFVGDIYMHEITGVEFDRIEKMGCASHSSKIPSPAASEIKTCFDLKEYGESIRNQTLDEVNPVLDQCKSSLKRAIERSNELHKMARERGATPQNQGQFIALLESTIRDIESLRTPSTQEHERGDQR